VGDNVWATAALCHSSVQVVVNQNNPTLLHDSSEEFANGTAGESFFDHPANIVFTWDGRDTPLTKYTPVNLRPRAVTRWSRRRASSRGPRSIRPRVPSSDSC
jgi:hypothetical protein